MITILTPSFRRDPAVLRRCFASVDAQLYRNWRHIIVVDDVSMEPHITVDIQREFADPRREFVALGRRSNDYGVTPRQEGMDRTPVESSDDCFVFLDDDNVIFPDYLETMMGHMRAHPDHDMAICKIIHMGPLPARLHPPPKVLDGLPPVLQNIDTLQVCVRAAFARKEGWLRDKGYMADGYTFERWAGRCKYGAVPAILGVHL
jgi:glycosyltransferase involved in cell wall biosynthesis